MKQKVSIFTSSLRINKLAREHDKPTNAENPVSGTVVLVQPFDVDGADEVANSPSEERQSQSYNRKPPNFVRDAVITADQ